jgi:hypothetical protein
MKKSIAILAMALLANISFAGECATCSGSGKGVSIPQPTGCGSILSYNYLEGGFIQGRFDGGDTSNGGYAEFSHEIMKNFFVDGQFTFLEDGLDTQEYGIGIGGYLPLTEKIHLIGRVGYSYLDAGAGFNQVYTSIGFRAQLCCVAELYGKLYYTHNRESDDISGGGGIIWHVTEHVGINTGAAWGDDGWTWQAGVRYQW